MLKLKAPTHQAILTEDIFYVSGPNTLRGVKGKRFRVEPISGHAVIDGFPTCVGKQTYRLVNEEEIVQR